MYPTPYPTPYPTANPTSAPTATCPVTCEIDNGQFLNKQVYGYKNFNTKSKYTIGPTGFTIAAGTRYTSIALADGCTVNDYDDQIEYITLDSTSGNTVSATVGYKPLHSGSWTMSTGVSIQCWHYANGWDSAPVLDRQDAGIGYSYGYGNGPARTHAFTFTVQRSSVAQHYLRCGIIDRSSSTCKFDDNNHCATRNSGFSSGHHYDNSDAPFTGFNPPKLYKRLVTTHNLEVINEHDSYAKHRCYKYGTDEAPQCTCECIDDEAFFMDTTHKGKNADQSIQTIATLKAAGKFWKAPNYWISHNEVQAVKKCCAEEVAINPEFILPAHSCADVLAATDEVIKTRIEELEPTTSNTKIINWLKAQGCYTASTNDLTDNHDRFDSLGTKAHTHHVYSENGVRTHTKAELTLAPTRAPTSAPTTN